MFARRPKRHHRRFEVRPRIEALEERCVLAVDPILEWNAIAIEVNRVSYSGEVDNDQVGPTRSSRALAITHAAMFDAWNSIHRKYTPYLVQAPNFRKASAEAAVAQAAHDKLVALYPSQTECSSLPPCELILPCERR
jgi:hypothetical protein